MPTSTTSPGTKLVGAIIEQFTAHHIEHGKANATRAEIPKAGRLDAYLKRLIKLGLRGTGRSVNSRSVETTTEVRVALQNVIAGNTLI